MRSAVKRAGIRVWKLLLASAFLNVFCAGLEFGLERWGRAAWYLSLSASMLAFAYLDARARRRQAGLPGDP